MEAELHQVREDLNRLMVRNASTFSSTERHDMRQPTEKFGEAASTLQQELQEIAVSLSSGILYNILQGLKNVEVEDRDSLLTECYSWGV